MVATFFLLMLLLLGANTGSAQPGTTTPPVSIDDNAVVQTRPASPETGTTVSAATTVPPLGPVAPAPTVMPASGTAGTVYVILLVTIPLVTMATIVWLQSHTRRQPLRSK